MNFTLSQRQVSDCFFFHCATYLFFDCFGYCGSQQHGIHYPSSIHSLTEMERVIKNPLHFHYILVCEREALYSTLSDVHIFQWVQQIPVFTCSAGKHLDMRFHPELQDHSSPVLLSNVMLTERRRNLEFMREGEDGFWWAVLGIYETWATAIHYFNSQDVKPQVRTMLTCRKFLAKDSIWATNPEEVIVFFLFLILMPVCS